MMIMRRSCRSAVILTVLMLSFFSLTIHASDHADPIRLTTPLEPGLTGLFVFPDGSDNLIVVLTTYRGLTFDAPYYLEPFEYRLHFDWHSQVDHQDQAANARYGGHVVDSTRIKADALITLRLNNDTSLAHKQMDGFSESDGIEFWTGVRDDPFIFPRFFGTNVIAMVAKIPLGSFPNNGDLLLVWGTSHKTKNGKQLDHVGRSNRTQLARLDFLNKLEPSEHVAVITEKYQKDDKRYALMKEWLPPLASLYELVFKVRDYDTQADVLVYSASRPLGFPNGRKLTDDVAGLTCQWGDCPLVEDAYVEGEGFPRQTVNDKAFLATFPYLAEPWPSTGHADDHTHFSWWWVLIAVLALFILFWFWRKRRAG